MNDIYVRLIRLPDTVRGITAVDENGDYNIYINSNLSNDQQKRVYEHECAHINNNDFDNFDDISFIERRADGKIAINN